MPAGGLSMVRKHPLGWKSNRSTTAMRVAAVVCGDNGFDHSWRKSLRPQIITESSTLTTPRRYTGT